MGAFEYGLDDCVVAAIDVSFFISLNITCYVFLPLSFFPLFRFGLIIFTGFE